MVIRNTVPEFSTLVIQDLEIDSGDGIRTCNENEDWVGDVPTCIEVTCVTVSAPLHGNIVSGSGN